MNKRKLLALVLTGVMAISTLAGCGSSDTKTSDTDVKASETAETSDKNVLRVGMECAYAPFNWTQDSDTTPDGSKAVPIYGSDYYAYGYDVAVAQKLADEMGMDLEVHKVEWSSIGISLDAGDYDVIIAGMGKTAEREASYSFTEPYYYRDNCIVVKKGSAYNPLSLAAADRPKVDFIALDTEKLENVQEVKLQVLNATGYAGIAPEKLLLAAEISAPLLDEDRTEFAAVDEMSRRVIEFGPLGGLAAYNISGDYYHAEMNYQTIRGAIQTLNPAK